MFFVGSLTTMPHRINRIKPILDSLIALKMDWIDFNIPFFCKRTGEVYNIPDWLLALTRSSNIRIHRTDDIGPYTKILPTMQRYANDSRITIISFDDDTVIVDPNYLNYFKSLLDSNSVVGGHGCKFITDDHTDYDIHEENLNPSFVEGFSAIAYPGNLYQNSVSDNKYFDEILKNKTALSCDDIIMSNFTKMKGVKLKCVGKLVLKKLNQLSVGIDDPHALYKVTGGHKQRYGEIVKFLKNMQQCYIF